MEATLVIATVGAFAGITTAAVAALGFWMALQRQISKAQASADNAKAEAENAVQVAAEAERDVKDAHARVTDISAAFALYRENSIREFVSYGVMTSLEKRLVESQAKTEQRMVDALDGLGKRLDRLVEAGLRGKGAAGG